MSEQVTLSTTADSKLYALVRALTSLEGQGLPPHALIGGVAVMIRLARVHRVTLDLDQVVEDAAPDVVDLLVARHAARRVGSGAELAGGVRLDVISTLDRPVETAELPDAEAERLFVLAHEWALRSAQPVELRLRVPGKAALALDAVVPVATSPALFVAKLQAAAQRPQASLSKRGTDVDDARRLLEVTDPRAVAEALTQAPGDLRMLTARLVDRLLIQEAERSVLWIKQAGAPGGGAVLAEDVRELGERLHRLLVGQ